MRYAKRLADRLHGPWTALYIESRRSLQLSEEERDRIADTLRLAEALGGEAVTIPSAGRRIADDVIGYAQANNVTQIIIGKSTRTRWFEILHGSVVHDLVRRSGNISVHVIAGDAIAGEPIREEDGARRRRRRGRSIRGPTSSHSLAVAAALGLAELIRPWVGIENIDLVFLTAIVGVAVRFGLWPSLLASVAVVALLQFLLPAADLHVHDRRSRPTSTAFVFFTVVAVIVSNVAARARTQAVAAMGRARTTESLYAFSRKLAGVGTLDDVLWATAYQTALMLKVRVVLLLPEDGSHRREGRLSAGGHARRRRSRRGEVGLGEQSRGRTRLRHAAGRQAAVPAHAHRPRRHRRRRHRQRQAGTAAHARPAPAARRPDRSGRAGHRARPPGRGHGSGEAHDRDRSAALGAAHLDLARPQDAARRGPRSGGDAARPLGRRSTDAEKADLLATIIDESERLNRFIANLLDMTRLESGAIVPNAAPHDLGEIVGSALRRAGKILARHRVELELAPRLPMLDVDAVLFEQVLFNLLDNAAKYSPEGTTIRIRSWRDRDSVCLQVLDEGDGIPPADLEHIFDKFYRVQKGDQVRAGTGLGLAISRGFVEAMHGTITAANRTRPQRRRVHDQAAGSPAGQAIGHRGMSAAPLKVLVVDDEPPIRKLLRMGLSTQGYEILEAPNGKAALELLAQNPDLIILDLGLPDIQGLELLRMIRGRNEGVPIVVLSSRGDEAGKVQALDLGADDYVTKPFGMDELLARMRAALRHQLQVHGERPIFRVGDLSVDLVRRIVKVRDKEVKLSPKEYDLLRVLVQHAGKVLTHKFLLGELWDDLTDAQYLRVYVRQLRQKIEADPERPHYILTETGIGYRLRAPD